MSEPERAGTRPVELPPGAPLPVPRETGTGSSVAGGAGKFASLGVVRGTAVTVGVGGADVLGAWGTDTEAPRCAEFAADQGRGGGYAGSGSPRASANVYCTRAEMEFLGPCVGGGGGWSTYLGTPALGLRSTPYPMAVLLPVGATCTGEGAAATAVARDGPCGQRIGGAFEFTFTVRYLRQYREA